jgi:phosphomevalonate kinase
LVVEPAGGVSPQLVNVVFMVLSLDHNLSACQRQIHPSVDYRSALKALEPGYQIAKSAWGSGRRRLFEPAVT